MLEVIPAKKPSIKCNILVLSGTKVRQMLHDGEVPPREFTRPEVAKILIEAMRETVA